MKSKHSDMEAYVIGRLKATVATVERRRLGVTLFKFCGRIKSFPPVKLVARALQYLWVKKVLVFSLCLLLELEVKDWIGSNEKL